MERFDTDWRLTFFGDPDTHLGYAPTIEEADALADSLAAYHGRTVVAEPPTRVCGVLAPRYASPLPAST